MGLVTVHASTPLRIRVSTRTRNPKLSSPRLFESETCPSATAGLLHASVLLVLSAACVHAVRCSVAMSEGVSKGVVARAAAVGGVAAYSKLGALLKAGGGATKLKAAAAAAAAASAAAAAASGGDEQKGGPTQPAKKGWFSSSR